MNFQGQASSPGDGLVWATRDFFIGIRGESLINTSIEGTGKWTLDI